MPLALVLIGIILVVTGARDTYKQFGALVAGDFTGQNNFTFWLVSLGAVGALGYVDALRPFSRGFLVLVLLSLVLSHKGVFDQFSKALQSRNAAASPTTATATTASQAASNDNSVTVSDAVKYAKLAAAIFA